MSPLVESTLWAIAALTAIVTVGIGMVLQSLVIMVGGATVVLMAHHHFAE